MSGARALLGAKAMFLAAVAGGCASIIGADFDDKYLLADAATSGDSASIAGAPGEDAASATGAQGGAGGAMGGAGGRGGTGGTGGRGGTGGMNQGGTGGASMPDAATGGGGASGGAGGIAGCPVMGVCMPNTTRTVSCGRCDTGSETQTCGSNCQWEAGTCMGETGCNPGQSYRIDCGPCTERLDVCNNSCEIDTGACNISKCTGYQICGTNGTCCYGFGELCNDSAACCSGYCDAVLNTCQ